MCSLRTNCQIINRHLYKKVTFQKGQWCKSYNAIISSSDCEGPMVDLEGWWKISVGFRSFCPVTNPLPMFFLMEKKTKRGDGLVNFVEVVTAQTWKKRIGCMDSNQSWPDVVWGGEDARACVSVQLFFFGTHVRSLCN